MRTMACERDIAAAPETVWSVITDLERSAEVISAIRSTQRLDDGSGFGVGTTWRETREMFGREAAETMAVTAIDEGRAYTVESDSGGAHYVTVMALQPAPGGCRLSMTFGAEATGRAARITSLIGRLFEGSTRKALARDLDYIAAAAEARAE